VYNLLCTCGVMFRSEPWVGFKVVASGATSTNPWSTAAGGKQLPLPGRRLAASGAESNVAAKAQASGLYSFYQVSLRYSQLEPEAWVRVAMLSVWALRACVCLQQCTHASRYPFSST